MRARNTSRWILRASAAATLCGGLVAAAALPASAAAATAVSADQPAVVDLSITDALAMLESGETTSVALTQRYLDRIAAYDDPYGDEPGLAAVITTNPDALSIAQKLDDERAAGEIRGPMHGVPILVKDNYATFDMPTSAGSATLATYQTTADSTAVQRLRDAGAIILGKTNMSEFAWHGTYTLSSIRGETHNPYNQENSASGSSGGTGAAVAAAFAAGGLGTDSCGSIVGPSAHQSLVGFRPTMGLTSVAGIVPLSLRQDVSGPMTVSVEDAALLLEVIAGEDPADPQTAIAAEQDTTSYVDALSTSGLEGKRIGYVDWDYEEDPERPGLEETTVAIDQAVADLEAQGAEIVEVPFTKEFLTETLVSGGWIDMRPSIDAFLADTKATWPEGIAELTEPSDELTFSDIMADGKTSLTPEDVETFTSNADIPNADYRAAVAAQDAGKAAIDAFFDEYDIDALAMPTSATSATPDWAGTTFCDLGANTGIPTMSIPAGFTSTGAAIGLELAAPRSEDAALLSMGYAYEQATRHRVAPASVPELPVAGAAPSPTATPEPTAAPTTPTETSAPSAPAETTDPTPTAEAPAVADPTDGPTESAASGDLVATEGDPALPIAIGGAAVVIAGAAVAGIAVVRRRGLSD